MREIVVAVCVALPIGFAIGWFAAGVFLARYVD